MRMRQKRERYLRRRRTVTDQEGEDRGSPDSGVSEGGGERDGDAQARDAGGGVKQAVIDQELRQTKDVTEEAAETLRNISTNFLSSLKYKEVSSPPCFQKTDEIAGGGL